jgi:hypothetical protein
VCFLSGTTRLMAETEQRSTRLYVSATEVATRRRRARRRRMCQCCNSRASRRCLRVGDGRRDAIPDAAAVLGGGGLWQPRGGKQQ